MIDYSYVTPRVLHLMYLAICFAGLCYQFICVSIEYFQYTTSTRIRNEYPSKYSVPAVTLCIRYTDVINYAKARSLGHKWSDSNKETIRKLQGEITSKEVFDLTPNEFDLVTKTIFRVEPGYTTEEHEGHSVQEVLDIKKFIYIEYICYRIRLKRPSQLLTSVVAVHPSDPGVLVYFHVDNAIFKRMKRYRLSVHEADDYPYGSLMLQPHLRKMGDTLNSVLAFPNIFTINYLPAPYATDCVNYTEINFQDKHHCVQSCLEKQTLEQFGKFPHSAFIMNFSNIRITSYNDVNNLEISRKLHLISNYCQNKSRCKNVSCKTSITSTLVNIVSEEIREFVIGVAFPLSPWTYINHEPMLNPMTYLTYLLGSFGTWTGLSIMSLSPFKAIVKKHLKEKPLETQQFHPSTVTFLSQKGPWKRTPPTPTTTSSRLIVEDKNCMFTRGQLNVY